MNKATSKTTRRRVFAAASVTAFGLVTCGWSSAHVQAAPTPAETLSVETAEDSPEAAKTKVMFAKHQGPGGIPPLLAQVVFGYQVKQAALAGKATVPVVIIAQGKAKGDVLPYLYKGTTPGVPLNFLHISPSPVKSSIGWEQKSPSKSGAVDPSDVEVLLD